MREAIRRHGLDADKRLGQHFLFDLNLTRRIARAAGAIGLGTVIEVGPGPGGLTRALLIEGAARLIAIERDPRCVAALGELLAAAGGRLDLLEADALAIDLATLGDAPRRIVANLPYNIGTPLLIGWLKRIQSFECLVLMFQREVVDRLTARPGGKDYGRLAVLTQVCAIPERLFDIPARAFTPPPRVVSAVVRLTPRPDQPSVDLALIEAVTAAAFGQRRKMLRSSLGTLGLDVAELLAVADLPGTARAEEIPVEGFVRLAETYGALRAGHR